MKRKGTQGKKYSLNMSTRTWIHIIYNVLKKTMIRLDRQSISSDFTSNVAIGRV